jgi:hypothetical protein
VVQVFHEGGGCLEFFGHFLSRFSRVSNVHMFCILLLWSSSNIKTIMTFSFGSIFWKLYIGLLLLSWGIDLFFWVELFYMWSSPALFIALNPNRCCSELVRGCLVFRVRLADWHKRCNSQCTHRWCADNQHKRTYSFKFWGDGRFRHFLDHIIWHNLPVMIIHTHNSEQTLYGTWKVFHKSWMEIMIIIKKVCEKQIV